MLQMVRYTILAIAVALFSSCDTVDVKGLFAPTGDVVNRRFEKSMSLNGGKAVATIDAEESYLFYVCTDPHIDNTSINLREFSTRMRNDGEALFGIVLGDCANRRDILPNYVAAIEYVDLVHFSNKPIFSVIGNHDLYFDGWDSFSKLLGASVYWFDVVHGKGKDLFIALDSASGTLGRKQMKWLREFLAEEREKYRHCIVLTHTNLFYTDNSQVGSGNLALEETALLTDLFIQHNVTLCLQGHDHYREDLVLDGVRYTIIGTIQDSFDVAEYLTIRLSDDGAEYNWVYLN